MIQESAIEIEPRIKGIEEKERPRHCQAAPSREVNARCLQLGCGTANQVTFIKEEMAKRSQAILLIIVIHQPSSLSFFA